MANDIEEIKITPGGALRFIISPFLGEYLHFWAMFFKYYLMKQYRGGQPVDVSLLIDREIPERADAFWPYLDLYIFPFALALYLKKEFGKAAVKNSFAEVEKGLRQIARVFQAKQTTFVRPSAKSIRLKLIRIVDRNRNCYPSGHAANLAKVYGIIRRLMAGSEKYAGVEKTIHRKLIAITEACVLTKQHSVQDLAAGFAAATITEPGFDEKNARDIIDMLFVQNSYGMPQGTIKKIHDIMREVYDKILTKYRSGKYGDYTDIFIEEIRVLEAASTPI